jgi:hypothetical protein
MNTMQARSVLRAAVLVAQGAKRVAGDYLEAIPDVADAGGAFLLGELLSRQVGASMGASITGELYSTGQKQAAIKKEDRDDLRDDAVETFARNTLHDIVRGRGKVVRRIVRR